VRLHASALFAAALAAIAGVAAAHPLPRAEAPAANAVLAASPAEIRITFSEGLVAAFSGLELKDGAGKAIALGPSTVSGADKKQLAAPLKAKLAPGTYTVSWHAIGDDTHHVTGHYAFTVR
jgi:methionine-rich copper-binding protein CopC